MKRKRAWRNKEKTSLGNEVDWLAQVFMVLSKRVDGARQKSRRCSAKESSVLSKRIDDAKRKQSIYSQKSLNCYALGGSNTGQKHSKIIVLSTWVSVKLSLCCLPVCGFIWSNIIEMGGFGKDTCFSDEIQCPYEDSCESLNHSWHRKGSTCHILQLPPMYG